MLIVLFDFLPETCDKKALVIDSCSENKENVVEAEKSCQLIFDKKFESCHEVSV